MDWKTAEAKQRFSEMIRQAAEEPQRIFNRDQLVAVMMDAEEYERFAAWKEQQRDRPAMARALAEIRRICSEETYDLEVPERMDRPDEFAEALDDVPV